MSATQLMIKKGGNEEEHDDHRGHDRYYYYYGSIFSVRDDCSADAEKPANIFFVGTGCRQGHDVRLGQHECFYIFIAFLAVGVVANSYAFEH